MSQSADSVRLDRKAMELTNTWPFRTTVLCSPNSISDRYFCAPVKRNAGRDTRMIARTVGVTVGVAALLMLVASVANAYEPPAQSTVLLLKVDFSAAVPVDEAYRREFVACDGGNAGLGRKDHFLGIDL